MMPWHAWLRQDIGAGTSTYHGEGGQTTIVPVQVNYDPRNDYERALSGSTVPPSEPPVEEPDSYPSNINANDTLNGILAILAVSYWNFDRGLLQGKLNIANGLTDIAADSIPVLWFTPLSGWDWSRDLIVHEGGTSGDWDDTHGWSKWAGATGVVTLLTLGAGAMARFVPHKFSGQTVEQILKTKLGSIKNADLPAGSPSWKDIMKMSWEQIEAAAKAKQIGFQQIKKLLTDGRFDK